MKRWWGTIQTAIRNAWGRPALADRLVDLLPIAVGVALAGLFIGVGIDGAFTHQMKSAVAGLLAGFLVLAVTAAALRDLANRGTPTLQSRLSEVRTSLESIGTVLHDLDLELATRTRALEDSQARLERYEQMTTVTPEQRDAIDKFFDQRQKEGRRSLRRDLFLLLLGVPVGFFLNVASAPLWHLLTK